MNRDPNFTTALTPLIALTLMAATGCGVIKAREDHTVIAHANVAGGDGRTSSAPPTGKNGKDSEDEALSQIRQFLDLYTDQGAVTREGLAHFLDKYKAQILPFLSGAHLSSQELIDLIFQFDADQDQRVTPQELSQGLMKRIPILRWIPDNSATVSVSELQTQIALEYPGTSFAAQQGLAETLMRFDQPFAEGNGDGKISRAEVSGAGIILAVLAQTDFSKGFTVPPGAITPVTGANGVSIDVTPLAGKLIQQKLDQQLFTRYPGVGSRALLPDDLKLEWMQLSLRFFLADKLVHHFTPTEGAGAGKILEATAESAFSAWGIPLTAPGASLRKIYDNALMAGDGDGAYNSIEAFNYLSDLEFAVKVRTFLRGDFSARGIDTHPAKTQLITTLNQLMPRIGPTLFSDGAHVRSAYWDHFSQFDSSFSGGDQNGAIDVEETAMGLLYAKQIENLYELFDADHDASLVRVGEGNALFAALGIYDRRIIDAFYADIGLNTAAPGFWAKLRLFFGGDHGWKRLSAYDFHIRLVQVLPRLLDRTPEDQP